ncbi:MAG: HAMP domain-containing sensor histidine kinase [Acidimicrobiia bacterium]
MRRRLLASYLSITLFVLIALGLPLGVSYANTEQRRLETDVQQDAFGFSQRAGALFDEVSVENAKGLRMIAEKYARDHDARVVIVDGSGAIVAASPGAASRTSTPAMVVAQRGVEVRDTYSSPGLGETVGVAVPVLSGGVVQGAVQVEVSRGPTAVQIRNNWLLLAALGGAILLVVGLVSTLLARSFTSPLAALDRGAARLGEGDLAVRVDVPDDPPELAGLARSFNATAERLEALVRSQQAFVADASHQLRTPLAALRLRLENLEAEREEGVESRPEDIERSLAEVQRLSQLVDSLLVLTRAEADRRSPEAVDVGAVVADRRDAWSAFAAEHGVEVVADTPVLHVRTVPGRMEQVLDNLISNALDVAPEGSTIRVHVERMGESAQLQVCDAGPGIPLEQRARAFDRFWRGGAARRDGGGFGLGLAIVRELVRADGGDVELGDAPEGGLAVPFHLPLATAPVPADAPPPTEADRIPSVTAGV